MKVSLICFATIACLFSFSCKKIKQGSKYTKELSGNHSFRRIFSGHHPYTGDFPDTTIMTINIEYKDVATIVFDTRTFSYVATNSDIVHYQYKGSDGYSNGDLYYDHAADTITAHVIWHESAAAGDWSNSYKSL